MEFTESQIKAKIEAIKERVNLEYKDRLFDGLLHELATTQLSLEDISFQFKILTSKLLLRDSLLPTPSIENQSHKIDIDAEFPLSPSHGFYSLEYNKFGVPFRWTGIEDIFYFDVFLDRTTRSDMTLILTGAIEPDNVEKLRCFIDGVEIPLDVSKKERMYYLKSMIPATSAVECTRISFLHPKPTKVSNVSEEIKDNRTLAVAFHRLVIKNWVENPKINESSTLYSKSEKKPINKIEEEEIKIKNNSLKIEEKEINIEKDFLSIQEEEINIQDNPITK